MVNSNALTTATSDACGILFVIQNGEPASRRAWGTTMVGRRISDMLVRSKVFLRQAGCCGRSAVSDKATHGLFLEDSGPGALSSGLSGDQMEERKGI